MELAPGLFLEAEVGVGALFFLKRSRISWIRHPFRLEIPSHYRLPGILASLLDSPILETGLATTLFDFLVTVVSKRHLLIYFPLASLILTALVHPSLDRRESSSSRN